MKQFKALLVCLVILMILTSCVSVDKNRLMNELASWNIGKLDSNNFEVIHEGKEGGLQSEFIHILVEKLNDDSIHFDDLKNIRVEKQYVQSLNLIHYVLIDRLLNQNILK